MADEPAQPTSRLIEQRLRNRAMEALGHLREGDAGVRAVGIGEYVEQFYDVIRDDPSCRWREWATFTAEELAALEVVLESLNAACAATAGIQSQDEFIASGWPARLQPAATRALDLMRARGRFREDVEEDTPSGR